MWLTDMTGGATGDQRVGRLQCGSPTIRLRSAALPPRFAAKDVDKLARAVLSNAPLSYDKMPYLASSSPSLDERQFARGPSSVCVFLAHLYKTNR